MSATARYASKGTETMNQQMINPAFYPWIKKTINRLETAETNEEIACIANTIILELQPLITRAGYDLDEFTGQITRNGDKPYDLTTITNWNNQ